MTDSNPSRHNLSLTLGVEPGNAFVGECIYCGSTKDLSDEHTIPYGLWGRNVLEKASCALCATATSKIEAEILRGGLKYFRELFDSPSRRKTKKKVRQGVVELSDEGGNKITADIQNSTNFVVVPSLTFTPRLLRREMRSKKHRSLSAKMLVLSGPKNRSMKNLWSPSVRFNVTTWSRFIAKMAYGEYVRITDINFRSPDLCNFILSGKGDLTKYVGGKDGLPRASYLYEVQPTIYKRADGTTAVLSHVRLFSFVGAPSYLVYLGDVDKKDSGPASLPGERGLWPNYDDNDLLSHLPEKVFWRPAK